MIPDPKKRIPQDSFPQKKEYLRLFEVFKAHNIEYFFYNGGGDSQDTTFKVSKMAKELKLPLTCIGIPKTEFSQRLWQM